MPSVIACPCCVRWISAKKVKKQKIKPVPMYFIFRYFFLSFVVFFFFDAFFVSRKTFNCFSLEFTFKNIIHLMGNSPRKRYGRTNCARFRQKKTLHNNLKLSNANLNKLFDLTFVVRFSCFFFLFWVQLRKSNNVGEKNFRSTDNLRIKCINNWRWRKIMYKY